MNIMTRKGYAAKIEYSDEGECFIGHTAGIKDVVYLLINTSSMH